jgi:hypothetical protein
MARPAFVNIPVTKVDLDSLGEEGNVFQALRDNAAAVRISLFGVDFTEQSHTGDTNWTSAGTFWLRAPNVGDYLGIQRRVLLLIEAKVTGGVTGEWRLRDATGAVDGATKTTSSATYVDLDLEVDIPINPGNRQYTVQFRTPSAGQTVFARAVDHYTGRLEY